jgi:hypothetical protein
MIIWIYVESVLNIDLETLIHIYIINFSFIISVYSLFSNLSFFINGVDVVIF